MSLTKTKHCLFETKKSVDPLIKFMIFDNFVGIDAFYFERSRAKLINI